jgi:hypothetical protein
MFVETVGHDEQENPFQAKPFQENRIASGAGNNFKIRIALDYKSKGNPPYTKSLCKLEWWEFSTAEHGSGNITVDGVTKPKYTPGEWQELVSYFGLTTDRAEQNPPHYTFQGWVDHQKYVGESDFCPDRLDFDTDDKSHLYRPTLHDIPKIPLGTDRDLEFLIRVTSGQHPECCDICAEKQQMWLDGRQLIQWKKDTRTGLTELDEDESMFWMSRSPFYTRQRLPEDDYDIDNFYPRRLIAVSPPRKPKQVVPCGSQTAREFATP